MSQAREAPDADAASTYRRVVDALGEWDVDPASGFPVERQVASTLEAALNGGPTFGADHHDVRVTPSGTADVGVDDAVAVVLFREFGPGTVSGFSGVVGSISRTYDYLVVVGYDLPARDLDRWRMGKARYTASRSDLADVAFLTHAEDEDAPTTDWPSTLWHYAEPLVALLAIVIGLEIAVLVQLQSGEPTPILGPAATVVTALVLMVLLVLLYERTEV